jgi:hypothetical protein
MQLSGYLKEHPLKSWKLRRATGGRCENCSNEYSPVILEIHIIGNPPDTGVAGRDLQKQLLVLCPACRHSFRSGRVEESLQRELVRHRAGKIRAVMREILGYRPGNYMPPGDFDPEVIFQEMVNSGATDHCLNGG